MDLLEKTELDIKVTDNGDHDRFQHYFWKKDIDQNLLSGTPMTALCGKVVDQQVDPKGRSICSECQYAMDNIVGSARPENDRD